MLSYLAANVQDLVAELDQWKARLDAGGVRASGDCCLVDPCGCRRHPPFADGNGRAARVLASLALYRGGLKLSEFTSLEEWWGRHLSDYYAAFRCLGERFDPGVDVTPFVRARMEAQLHQIRALELRERVQHRVWTAIEEVVASARLEPRVANAAWDVFFGRSVTPRYYRPLADVSPSAARRRRRPGLRSERSSRPWRRSAGG